jgi:UDP-GlcNAc:undecaprenyl-phosphate GlcNAc-1-phosphate transferase
VPGRSGYAIVGLVAALATFVTTPMVKWAAVKLGRLTPPDERRVHSKPTPSVGGVAMYIGLLASLAVAWRMDRFRPFFGGYEVLGLAAASTVVFVVGFIDEWYKARPAATHDVGPQVEGISAPAKLTGIVAAGILLVFAGVTMWNFRIPFGRVLVLSTDIRPLVTVVWLALMTTAINLIDGLDGLAAGIVAIAAGTFFLYSFQLSKGNFIIDPSNIGTLVAAIACGVCVGFLPWNVHPARIFMGDCGALLLGLLMSVCTSVVGGRVDPGLVQNTKGASGQTYFFFAPLIIPIVVLGVPLLDTVFAVLRRASKRGDVTSADKDHLHHRLMRLGHGHRRSVAILWIWTALLSAIVLYPTYTARGNGLVPIAVAGLALMLYTVLHPQVRKKAKDERRRRHPAMASEREVVDGAISN